jgi:hypothetical protein
MRRSSIRAAMNPHRSVSRRMLESVGMEPVQSSSSSSMPRTATSCGTRRPVSSQRSMIWCARESMAARSATGLGRFFSQTARRCVSSDPSGMFAERG